MNLKQLKYFYWVAKLGSYTRAAAELGVSEPSVCRGVRSFERNYGVPLLSGGKGRTTLTTAGRILLEYAERIQQMEAGAEESIAEFAKPRSGLLLYGSSWRFADRIGQCLASWKLERRELRVGMVVGLRSELYARVLAGELAFTFAPIVNLPAGLATVGPPVHDELVFVARAGHPLSKRRIVSQAEIVREQVVMTFPGTVVYGLLSELSDKTGVAPNLAVEVDRTETMIELIAAGVGIGILSRYAAPKYIKQGRLCIINVEGFPRPCPYGFVARSGVALSLEAASLVSHLAECLPGEESVRANGEIAPVTHRF